MEHGRAACLPLLVLLAQLPAVLALSPARACHVTQRGCDACCAALCGARRWVKDGWGALEAAGRLFNTTVVKDIWGQPVLLFRNEFALNQVRGARARACVRGGSQLVRALVGEQRVMAPPGQCGRMLAPCQHMLCFARAPTSRLPNVLQVLASDAKDKLGELSPFSLPPDM